ncbi:hypothetical protein ACH3WN_12015 [Streptomyces albogriseolus]
MHGEVRPRGTSAFPRTTDVPQEPAVLNDWLRRATALADAFREERRPRS